MRILRLDLLAFGPFTERSLEFGAAARLYLVHGANEAGKSSSLRALRHLLYGIPQQTPDNFLHPYQNLRIGGVLETADGARLEFIRRKGRAKTLRAPDDSTVLDESTLEDALAGVDEAAFAQRFGIDYDELRRGGEAIAAGGGDLGEVLFAAGAGVADLRQIQEGFDKEADELFKPRGSTQRIAQSLADLEKCRKEIRESQLLPAQWVKHDEALQKAVERQQKIDEQLSRHRTDRSRLNRISRS
ncbi:MAG: AAA family ATPase, partial [Planctomycetota bacterium]